MIKKLLIVIFSILLSTQVFANQATNVNSFIIIDVREKEEVDQGMIDQAKWFPLSRFSQDKNWKEDFLKLTKDKKILIYCRSGKRAEKVKDLLKENGIESKNIGGYEKLKKEGIK